MEFFINNELLKRQKEVSSTKGYKIQYTDGSEKIDLLMGNTAYIFGYDDKELLEAHSKNTIMFAKNSYLEKSKETDFVIKNLLEMSGMAGLGWTNSGTDANETAIAMNNEYWKKVNPKKRKYVSFFPSYHGCSYLMGLLRLSSNRPPTGNVGTYKLTPSDDIYCIGTPNWENFDDREESERIALNKIQRRFEKSHEEIGLFIVESLPMVFGTREFTQNFYDTVEKLCKEYDINLMIDDCMGSFGKLHPTFSHNFYGIKPNIVTSSKTISGGYSPLSVALCDSKINDVLSEDPWEHGYTHNPNMGGIYCAESVIQKVKRGDLNKIYELNKRMKEVFEKVPYDYRASSGLIFDIKLGDDVENRIKRLWDSGFSINPWATSFTSKCIPMCVPLIADDNYFIEVERILTESF